MLTVERTSSATAPRSQRTTSASASAGTDADGIAAIGSKASSDTAGGGAIGLAGSRVALTISGDETTTIRSRGGRKLAATATGTTSQIQ